MSSNITLSAATRQNLLSLQGTADLLATTQNRLATNKKVNSALDNPTNFFTADGLSSRSKSLSSLLDGISNGIQTIQAANTGLTKLQGLTDQLKSVAQQALASSNAFTSKATTTSVALTGATAANLLSTGPTQAVSDTAISSGATAAAATRTASINFATGTAATVTGAPYTMPANAVASSTAATANFVVGATGDTITFTGGGLTSATAVTIDNKSLADTVTAINGNATLTAAGFVASNDGGKLKVINTNGTAFSAKNETSAPADKTAAFGIATAAGAGGTAAATTTLTIAGTAVTISGGKSTDSAATVLAAALTAINNVTGTTGVTATAPSGALVLTGNTNGASFTVSNTDGSMGFGTTSSTVYNKSPAAETLTINGQDIVIASGSTQAQALATINAATSTTGVTATAGSGANANKIVLTGSSDGASFSVKGSTGTVAGFNTAATTISGTFNPTATTLTTSLGFKAGDNFTVNGQTVNIAAGETISSLVQKVTVATNGTVSASFDASADTFKFTAADSNTAVTLGNGSSATSLVSNLGYSMGKTSFAAGLGSGSASPLAGTSLTVTVGSGSPASFTFGSLPGQISTLTQLNAALNAVNAQATIDSATGKISITTANDNGADTLKVDVSGGTAFVAGTTSAIIGGDGANARRSAVANYNILLNQINQLASDSGFNGLNLLAGDNLKVVFNERGSSLLSVQGSTVNISSLGLGPIDTDGFQENGLINKVMTVINSASSQLKAQASSLGSNLAVVQNRQDFTKQIINVLDTGAGNLVNADLNEEAANSQALSTRNSLGISALALANQAQQGVLQLLR